MTNFREQDKPHATNEVVYGTAPRGWGIPDDYAPPKLAPLLDHLDLGEHVVGVEKSYVVATPFLMNHSEGTLRAFVSPIAGTLPSAFGDQLGIDPEQSAAAAFTLASSPSESMSWRYPTPPVVIRVKPSRVGQLQAMVTLSIIGPDGSTDAKRIRVSAVAKPAKPEAPKIVDDIHQPDEAKAITGAAQGMTSLEPVPPTETFDSAATIAMGQAEGLGAQELEGARIAKDELTDYKKAPTQPELFDQLIEIAFMMGVSGVAGVVSKYIAKNLGNVLAPPSQDTISMRATSGPLTPQGRAPEPGFVAEAKPPMSNATLIAMTADAAKEGIKGSAKVARKATSGATGESGEDRQHASKPISTNPVADFLARYRRRLLGRTQANRNAVGILQGLLAAVEPDRARAAMDTFSRGLNAAAQNAAQFHANALSLQWIAAAARQSLGEDETKLPDGSLAQTTKLDGAREYRSEGMLKAPSVPTHDGVLDIHVDLPVGSTPVETSGLTVRRASITGVAQATADRLREINLREAGIPLRFVVHGHPALITRDEIGRVRITGYLLTKDTVAAGREPHAGATWSEAHMHRGAKFLVDKVLSKTLAEWGITGDWTKANRIETDDTSPKEQK